MNGAIRKRFRPWIPAMPGSLRFQLLSRSLMLMAALLLLIGCLQFVLTYRFLVENKAEGIQSQVRTADKDIWARAAGIAGTYSPGGGDGDSDSRRTLPYGDARGPGEGRDGGERDVSLLFGGASVAYIDDAGGFSSLSGGQDGEASTPSAPRLSDEDYGSVLADYPGGAYRVLRDGTEGRTLVVLQTVEIHGTHGIVQVSVDLAPLILTLLRQSAIFAILAACSLIAAWLVMQPVLGRTLSPLSRLVKLVGEIDAGRLAVRFPERQGQVEIDRLSTSFNGMLARLEASFAAEKEAKETMRRFVADASHELRTPMTSIHGFLEVLLRGAAGDADRLEKSLTSMLGETKRINKLVEDLLLLAKLDQAPPLRTAREPLGELLREMEPQWRVLAGERSVAIDIETECVCRLDADKLKQVVLNLFRNAVEHTDAKTGRIRISLTREGERAVVSVEDNGEGIAAEHLARIFDRFYRIDASRARKNGGAGLGLSISRSIVERHGGTIEASSVAGAGSVFRILLPADDSGEGR
ncbi:sensor histidine kinase [Cohnella zeiphila]|uniref:histidine kinase n=1 Tax=Cohnella zeiphila TaxID=2761120 RepID=A0A7X0SW35_9BACL|nr:HAMP domain-containing sensor histidine kinase [Cohnella zeiphila]MBB6735033.1 HAMP domain-containing protein [Cohnella zeiphila]